MAGEKKQLGSVGNDAVLLVGPEGDFTPSELELSIANGFQPVSLGASRLRTETAGIVGAVMMR
jgi:16S rRNA (uracil1498-N3)-methyltransferase